jgi:hypothetical protein
MSASAVDQCVGSTEIREFDMPAYNHIAIDCLELLTLPGKVLAMMPRQISTLLAHRKGAKHDCVNELFPILG